MRHLLIGGVLSLTTVMALAAEPPAAAAGPQQLQLDAAAIRGNQELPKVLYIVPWKDPAMVELSGRPVNSLIEEVLAPVDRDEFRRQVKYYAQLQASPAAGPVEVQAP